MLIASKQSGYVVISVLLITTILTVLATSAISETRLQERISGNQIKEINAHSNAEKGMFASRLYIKQQIEGGKTVEQIKNLLNGQSVGGQYTIAASNGSVAESLEIISAGEYQGAIAYLQAEVLIEYGPTIPDPAIIACKGVSLVGAGLIDSFDSRLGAYDEIGSDGNINVHSDAKVVIYDGPLDISGGANLKGDVTVNGDVTSINAGAAIDGGLAASGTISLTGTSVGGNVRSGFIEGDVGDDPIYSSISLSGGSFSSDVSSLNEIIIPKDGATVAGSVTANQGFDLPGTWYDLYENLGVKSAHTSGAIAPVMPENDCNKLKVVEAFELVAPNAEKSTLLNTAPNTLVSVAMGVSSASGFENGGILFPLEAQTSTLWEGEKPVYTFDHMDLSNTMITVVGDIVIKVKGDLSTANGNSGFKFEESDTSSSLILLVEGQVNLDSDSAVFSDANIDEDNEVPFTLYSSNATTCSECNYGDSYAVSLLGGSTMYAKIYAPLGDINYGASGEMMGSLEGLHVIVSGDGDIHFDEALTSETDPDFPPELFVKFTAIHDYYPN